ncbi:hypothetical protein HYI36_05065 [Bacillus sp. Gen3]|nr:hypothetical protein [Bacillus sp. Gen3]
MKHTYYFRIEADAGMAHDVETGENASCYSKVTLDFKDGVSEDHAKKVEPKIRTMLSKQLGISEENITIITKEEYEDNEDDMEENE